MYILYCTLLVDKTIERVKSMAGPKVSIVEEISYNKIFFSFLYYTMNKEVKNKSSKQGPKETKHRRLLLYHYLFSVMAGRLTL